MSTWIRRAKPELSSMTPTVGMILDLPLPEMSIQNYLLVVTILSDT